MIRNVAKARSFTIYSQLAETSEVIFISVITSRQL